jgi:hypothetical protein
MDYYEYLHQRAAKQGEPEMIEPSDILVAEFASIDDAPESYRAYFAHFEVTK